MLKAIIKYLVYDNNCYSQNRKTNKLDYVYSLISLNNMGNMGGKDVNE